MALRSEAKRVAAVETERLETIVLPVGLVRKIGLGILVGRSIPPWKVECRYGESKRGPESGR